MGIKATSTQGKSVNVKNKKDNTTLCILCQSLLGNGQRQNLLSSDVCKENLVRIVVSEVHCICHW